MYGQQLLITTPLIKRQIKYGCEKAGIQKIRVHGIRHTHASSLIDMGHTLLLVSECLVHEEFQTFLDTYTHLNLYKQNRQLNIRTNSY